MSELLAIKIGKGLRKRRSTTVIKEEDESRKKHVLGNKEEEVTDITETITTKMREFIRAKDMNEQKARENSLRVQKKARTRPQSICYRCKMMTGINGKAQCLNCEHWHYVVYIFQTQEHLSTSKPS